MIIKWEKWRYIFKFHVFEDLLITLRRDKPLRQNFIETCLVYNLFSKGIQNVLLSYIFSSETTLYFSLTVRQSVRNAMEKCDLFFWRFPILVSIQNVIYFVRQSARHATKYKYQKI